MTVPIVKLKIVRKPVVKAKMLPRFPGLVSVLAPLLLDRTGGNYAFSLNLNGLIAMLAATFEPFHAHVDQPVTAGASADVQTNAETVRINKAVGSATTLNLPAAKTMQFPVLVVDWKGDAATNNITIVPNGTETINGLASWVLAANNASVLLRPIPGVGYAL